MRVILAHNNATDHVLLVDGDRVLSAWDVDDRVLRDYLRDGGRPEDWHVGIGIDDDDYGYSVDDYGEVVGQDGRIDDAGRRRFYGLD